jgi:hypothetical protein
MKPKVRPPSHDQGRIGIHPAIDRSGELIQSLLEAGFDLADRQFRAFALELRRRRAGEGAWTSLRPGPYTPLWNELRRQLRPHLRKRGSQAALGRLLSLPRQQINAFVTGGGRMPDAERTLLLLAWLMAKRCRRTSRPERTATNS